MKISTRTLPYEEVLKLPRLVRKKPLMPSRLLATVVRLASLPTLWKTKFSYTTDNAAMVAVAGLFKYMDNDFADLSLTAYAR